MTSVVPWFSSNLPWLLPTFVTIGLAVYTLRKQRTTKTLDYIEDYRAPLVSERSHEVKQRFQVMVDGEEVRKPFAQAVILRNTGNTPIDASDHREMVTISSSMANLVDCEVYQDGDVTGGPHMWSFDSPGSEVAFDAPLLNAGEELVIRMIWDGDPKDISVKSRIFGQTRSMKRIAEAPLVKPWAWALLLGCFVGAFVTAGVSFRNLLSDGLLDQSPSPARTALSVSTVALTGVAITIMAYISRRLAVRSEAQRTSSHSTGSG